jgi:hypothetical protein
MQCLAESLTKKFPVRITTDYTRMGWAYLREGEWVLESATVVGTRLFSVYPLETKSGNFVAEI